MPAHRVLSDIFQADGSPDPGSGGTITVDRSPCYVGLISAAAEARTLARPTRAGAYLTLQMKTDGGDITVTVTGGYDEPGSTALVFDDVGQFAMFVSCEAGGVYYWRLVANHLTGAAGNPASNVITQTTSSLTLTPADSGKLIVLNLAAGIAVTLPTAAKGLRYRFFVQTTFTGAATIKSATGADVMIGHALMGNNSDNTVVDWPATAADTFDTIDLLGTSNSTGGMAGQEIEIIGLAANLWYVTMRGDASGTEATPFANTVA